MAVTVRDVAKRAGVSAKTVSRVTNGEKEVSAETRERILRVVEEMGYVPHAQAQRLASGKTRSVALHYPLSNPNLYSERLEMNFITGIAMGAARENYYFTLLTGEITPAELTRICRASIADGMILMQVGLVDWRVEVLKKLHIPFVLIGRCENNQDFNFIDFDFENAVIDAFAHLVELGHKQIGFLTYPESWQHENLGPAIRAYRGFAQALRRFDLEPIYRETDLAVEAASMSTSKIIEQHPQLTAFVVVHNIIAVGAINAIQSLGRNVPEHYSILGVALGQESDLIIPPLTAIHWQGDLIGQQAAKMLIAQLKNEPAVAEQILVPYHIEIHGSTARASQSPR